MSDSRVALVERLKALKSNRSGYKVTDSEYRRGFEAAQEQAIALALKVAPNGELSKLQTRLEQRNKEIAYLKSALAAAPVPPLLTYMTSESKTERCAAYLRIHAGHIRNGTTEDIPNTVAATLEMIAAHIEAAPVPPATEGETALREKAEAFVDDIGSQPERFLSIFYEDDAFHDAHDAALAGEIVQFIHSLASEGR